MNKFVGLSMMAVIFIGLFVIVAIDAGIIHALLIYGGVFALVAWISFAAYLITK